MRDLFSQCRHIRTYAVSVTLQEYQLGFARAHACACPSASEMSIRTCARTRVRVRHASGMSIRTCARACVREAS